MALGTVLASPAVAQDVVSGNTDLLRNKNEITINTKESDSVLFEKILNNEQKWESFAQGKRGVDNPKSFTIVSRSDIDKSMGAFTTPLNDRYISTDIVTNLVNESTHYPILGRSTIFEKADNAENNLLKSGVKDVSSITYTKPAYYFVIEQNDNKGTIEFVAKMISLNDKLTEILGVVESMGVANTVENENDFKNNIIPKLQASIKAKINELGLVSQN